MTLVNDFRSLASRVNVYERGGRQQISPAQEARTRSRIPRDRDESRECPTREQVDQTVAVCHRGPDCRRADMTIKRANPSSWSGERGTRSLSFR